MTPAKLAEVLAERLGEIVPLGFRVVADNGTLWYKSELAVGVGAGTDIQVNLGGEEPSAEQIRSVSELAQQRDHHHPHRRQPAEVSRPRLDR